MIKNKSTATFFSQELKDEEDEDAWDEEGKKDEEGEEGEEGVEGETRVARNLPKISHDGRQLSCPKPPAPSMSKTVPMWAGLQFANDNDMVF